MRPTRTIVRISGPVLAARFLSLLPILLSQVVRAEHHPHILPAVRLRPRSFTLDLRIGKIGGVLQSLEDALDGCLDDSGRLDRTGWQAKRQAFQEHVVED